VLLAILAAALAGPPDDLQAVGVVLSGNPLRSVAVLRSAGRSRLVAMGETAFEAGWRRGHEAVVLDSEADGSKLRLTTAVTHMSRTSPTSGPPPRPRPPEYPWTTPGEPEWRALALRCILQKPRCP
jgi:hypothetical protein